MHSIISQVTSIQVTCKSPKKLETEVPWVQRRGQVTCQVIWLKIWDRKWYQMLRLYVTHEPNAVRITESHGNLLLDLKTITIIYIFLSQYTPYLACEGEKWAFLCEFEAWSISYLNSSPPGQNGHHFAHDIFTDNFANEKICILIKKISLKFVPEGPIYNKQAFLTMAWRRIGHKLLAEPILTHFTDAYMRYQEEMSWWL